jgi:FkbM family methyltransferase
MTRVATFEIAGGARIVVPDSLNSITPYVLYEQHDWFEEEIVFLRRMLKPGQQAIDVGANYGVYTLSIAKLVGPSGAVWAFEPASTTADFLAQGIAANNFTQVSIERSALSSRSGSSQLTLNDNSELNTLTESVGSVEPTETVCVTTLDESLRKHGWKDIDFLKIDAEGEELNIIKGGQEFFASLSPLILYEVKAGMDLHLELEGEFAAIGYRSFRLVPGLNLLVPFILDSKPDGFLLNLFCCKQDRSALLCRDGFLVESKDFSTAELRARFLDFSTAQKHKYGWRSALANLPYGAVMETEWGQMPSSTDGDVVCDSLAHFSISQDESLPQSIRFAALEHSFRTLGALCRERPIHLRLLSFARVAREYGARSEAVAALGKLFDRLKIENRADFGEPFLAPGKRFDAVQPGANLRTWLMAAILEEYEHLAAYSSFFTGDASKSRLEAIASLGFGSQEMQRRLQLVQLRFPSISST